VEVYVHTAYTGGMVRFLAYILLFLYILKVHPEVIVAITGALDTHHGALEDNSGALQANPGPLEANPGAWNAHPGAMKVN